MSDSFLLTADELAELTGYKKPTAQIRWLTEEGFTFVVGGDGRAKVLRELVVRRLGSAVQTETRIRAPQLRLT